MTTNNHCFECDNGRLQPAGQRMVDYNCGLPVKVAATVHQCDSCGEEEFGFDRPAQLHKAIAHFVASKKEALSPREITFLRKAVGWGNDDMADFFAVSVEDVERWQREGDMPARDEGQLRKFGLRGVKWVTYSLSNHEPEEEPGTGYDITPDDDTGEVLRVQPAGAADAGP
jgi:DNA-binding transcriptional regulator YiaG